MRTTLLLLLLAACSKKKGDDCQQFADKSHSVLTEMTKGVGKPLPADYESKFLDECRKHPEKIKKDPVFKCVLDAKSDDAVKQCYSTAFSDYASKGRRSEAQLQLNKLAKNLKVAAISAGTFPKGKAGPTPAQRCCDQPDHKCAVVKDWSSDPAWSALEFAIDEPSQFQYTYESDGQKASATAIGDLDCDGQMITYKLEATLENGEPKTTINEPTEQD